jgi:succinate dehydrogenase / fumarate reductase membrane anchor subunit
MTQLGWTKPESRWDLYSWLFLRVSGLALVVLALRHMVIMHLLNNVGSIDYQFVVRRYATPFWPTYDLVMLWLAMAHGLLGARVVLGDYILSRGWRVAALSVMWLLGFIFLALGSVVIFTFHPATPPGP